MMRAQSEVESLLSAAIGLDPASVGSESIERATATRMRATALDDPQAYAALLRQSTEEMQALAEQVVVPESWFFRDSRPFDLLQTYARERTLQTPGAPPLNVLSAPCAGGEEPYSIAIALLEAGLPSRGFQIDAIDLSARAIQRALQGLYSPNAFREPQQPQRACYFQHRPGGWLAIDPELKRCVNFQRGNLLDPGLPANHPHYDIIFCRNFLIYLVSEARKRLVAKLEGLLHSAGLLFVGHAEALTLLAPRFAAVAEPGCFAYRKVQPRPASARPALTPAVSDRTGRGKPSSQALRTAAPASHAQAAHVAKGDRAKAVDRISSSLPAGSALVAEASELANQRRYPEAALLCEQSIRDEGPSVSAIFMLGMIRQAAGDSTEAEECFHRVVYLDGHHDEALLSLALIAQRRGDSSAAAGYRRRARRASERKQSP
jgi:chemotaxis protein methyltransferase WspC